MIDDQTDELASLNAFDLLEGAEREHFVAELKANPELRARSAEFHGVVASIALAVPVSQPPESLKARILESASKWAAPSPQNPVQEPIPFPFQALIPWLAAACLGFAVWYGVRYTQAQRDIAALRDQQAVAQAALEASKAELAAAHIQVDDATRQLSDARRQVAESRRQLAESAARIADLDSRLKSEGDLANYKISTLASMLGNSPAAVAVAVWDPAREQGVLTVSKLPATAAEKDYQLWIIDAKVANPVSAGVFAVDPVTGDAHIVFKGDKPTHSVAKFAVSLERKGGVPAREGPVVLLSQ
jgi:hypothetical protein